MMTFAESSTNDFVVDDLNNLALASNQDALVQLARSVIERQRGEMQYLADEGIPTEPTLWDGVPNQLQYQFFCRQAILQLDGVIDVARFDTEITEDNRLIYDARISTIYGLVALNNEFTL